MEEAGREAKTGDHETPPPPGLTWLFVCGQPQTAFLCGPQFPPGKKKAWIRSLPRPLIALTFCDFLISFRLRGLADPMLMAMNKTWASESSQYCRYLLGFVLHSLRSKQRPAAAQQPPAWIDPLRPWLMP